MASFWSSYLPSEVPWLVYWLIELASFQSYVSVEFDHIYYIITPFDRCFLTCFYRKVFILVSTGLSGYGCMITDIPALQVTLFLVLLSCCIAPNVVSSATVELYPTNLRWIIEYQIRKQKEEFPVSYVFTEQWPYQFHWCLDDWEA